MKKLPDIKKQSLALHRKLAGKIETTLKYDIKDKKDLSLVYTPGVAEACLTIAKDPKQARELTWQGNTIAIVSDGTAVLGLGDIGPAAGLPVMEGKAALFKKYGGVNAVPLCIATKEPSEIIDFVKKIAPTFGGINLEDISAPRCFAVEEALQDLGIPVFHDDQHGTAIVVLAALLNSLQLAGKKMSAVKVVINGAGAAGIAIANILMSVKVGEIVMCDSHGLISKKRSDIKNNKYKLKIARETNSKNLSGDLAVALKNADVFIGVSKPNLVTPAMIKSMAERPIIFAMANPDPEILPDVAVRAGAFVVGTGRSDFPNQINNLLAFPGIFAGALKAKATRITPAMKLAAAHAIATAVKPTRRKILPSPLAKPAHRVVIKAVIKAAH